MRGKVKKLSAATAAAAVVIAGGAVAAATTADAAPASRAAGTAITSVTPRAASAPRDRYLSGWLPYWSASTSYAVVRAHASRFVRDAVRVRDDDDVNRRPGRHPPRERPAVR